MKGMTGYGYAEWADARFHLVVELKSYNNKYADINLMLPANLAGLDDKLRNLVRTVVIRGRVDIGIRFRDKAASGSWTVDADALEGALSAIEHIKARIGDHGPLKVESLLSMEGILRNDSSRNIDEVWAALEPVFKQALDELDSRRRIEGEATRKDLERQLATIESARNVIQSAAQGLEASFKETLRKRFAEILGDMVEESRVLQEVAVMLVRYSIHEELERLGLHCRAMGELLAKGEGVAKRIDFISQEMNREANTIGSKSVDAGVSAAVVDIKEAIDIIREQVRNIE